MSIVFEENFKSFFSVLSLSAFYRLLLSVSLTYICYLKRVAIY